MDVVETIREDWRYDNIALKRDIRKLYYAKITARVAQRQTLADRRTSKYESRGHEGGCDRAA